MTSRLRKRLHELLVIAVCVTGCLKPTSINAQEEITADAVLRSIDRARNFLLDLQNADGSWGNEGNNWHIGETALVLVALLNSEMTVKDEPIRNGLRWLRTQRPNRTYEVALKAMALADAKTGVDGPELQILANLLEKGQNKGGKNVGMWGYNCSGNGFDPLGGDRSNSQYAVLGLRAAVSGGARVSRETWLRAQLSWVSGQSSSGAWGYSGDGGAMGSMTVAGIATLTITSAMLKDDNDLNPDGTPNCCADTAESDAEKAIAKGIAWMSDARNFTVRSNPGGKQWLLYYLYGMERAGRLSGSRFFGRFDWYREGAEYLVDQQDPIKGSWHRVSRESNPLRGTSFGLLFLSKGLAPVVINKLKYGPRDPRVSEVVIGDNKWNKHPNDVRNLTEMISGLRGWPKMLNWQTLDIDTVRKYGSVKDILQSKLLYLSGNDRPEFNVEEITLLRQYVEEGGYIVAVNNCETAAFESGFRDLIKLMYPDGAAELKPLDADHPVFRAEYVIQPDSIELMGVDVGCRTSIFYSPIDIACGWQKWTPQLIPSRQENLALQTRILRDTRVGVNLVAYCTGREPPKRLEKIEIAADDDPKGNAVERGLLQIAKLRHEGGWDAAPQAIRNLLLALNKTVGLAASTKQRVLPATDPKLYHYPIMYMHGRNEFRMAPREIEQIKTYVERGNVLIADACCGSPQFDASFRKMIARAFPNAKFERIPVTHEIFNADVNHDLRRIRRRSSTNTAKEGLINNVNFVEPFLEGIKIGDRYAVIYSKYDISCALERQTSVACSGYVHEDAVKLAVNMVLYAMLQQIE